MPIYALSTGPGVSGVAVIRLSGKGTSEVIKKISGKTLPKARVATIRKFYKSDNKDLIDEGILIWFPGPKVILARIWQNSRAW